ncbi:MAG: hypothetical protein HY721_26620 [Planctomycetes bacterium]|nr:hypothetical protein [Planctomycetota bacterium]
MTMRLSGPAAVVVLLSIASLSPAAAADPFRRGEVNGDGAHDLTDAVVILTHLFLGGGPIFCADSADVNDDGRVDIADPIRLLNYLFAGSGAPPPPYEEPGQDPTDDGLDCNRCGARPARAAAIACLSGAESCLVLEDSPIDPLPRFRNDAPAVALDANGAPHVVYSVAENGYHGYHAVHLEGAGWSIQEMIDPDTGAPVSLATVDLVSGEAGLLALVNGGDLQTWLWAYEGGEWRRVDKLRSGIEAGRSHGLERSEAGCLHASFETRGTTPGIAVRAGGSWGLTTVESGGSLAGTVLALSPGGDARIAYWYATGEEGWKLRWSGGRDGPPPQTVATLGSNVLDRKGIGFDLTNGGDGVVGHFLFLRAAAERPGGSTLEYVARSSFREVARVPVAEEPPRPSCPEPAVEGDVCELELTTFHPHRIVADAAGDVLLLYSRHVHKVSLVASCRGGEDPPPPPADAPPGEPPPAEAAPPPPACAWEGTEEIQGDLLAARIVDGVARSTVIAPGVAAASLDVVAGKNGELHMAAYDVSSGSDSAVRYLRVGAR